MQNLGGEISWKVSALKAKMEMGEKCSNGF
jgi:hypothetical protein